MHVMKAIPNAGKYLEFSIEGDDYYPWQRDLFVDDPFRVQDGRLTIEDTPGWGVEVNPNWLANSVHKVSNLNDWQPSAYGALYDNPKLT